MKHPYRKPPSRWRMIYLLIALLVIFAAFFIWRILKMSSNVLTRFVRPSFNIERHTKTFGTAGVDYDENDNPIVKLSTDSESLNTSIEKAIEDLRTKASSQQAYSIDCKSDKLFDQIDHVRYMLFDNNKGEGEPTSDTHLYFSHRANKVITNEILLRRNYAGIITYRHPEINSEKLASPIFTIESDKVIFYDETNHEPYEVDLASTKDIWNPESGVPSLFEGEWKPEPERKPVTRPENGKLAVLTFDDGPINEWHEKMLDLLDSYGIKGSFFFVGQGVESMPEAVQMTFDRGHEINNHSWSHPFLPQLSAEQQADEILNTDDAVLKITGRDPEYFRPPYGASTQMIPSITKAPVVLWNNDSLDWKSRNAEAIVKQVKEELSDETVILMHGIYESSYEALKTIIPYLIDNGYQIVRYDEFEQLTNTNETTITE